ncbi:MAG TPA: entericidin EcnAB [Sphingomicrobium sp.]|jgi:predicted small secreted protein
MVKKLTTLAVLGAALAVAACNTVRGVGQDVQSVANCGENAIDGTGKC